MKNVIIITGPTASGKSDMAVKVAKERNGEIISCDSMQIYRGMNIGTATPTMEERQGIIHHNFDIVEADSYYSVAQFKKRTINTIEDILNRGKLPIITGGTGLYIDSILYNIQFKDQIKNNEIREKYEKIYENMGIDYLYDLLLKRDKNAGKTVHKNNIKRVIRSLEILEDEIISLEEYKKNAISENTDYHFVLIVLNPSRELVYEKIEKRIDVMLSDGLIDEVSEIYNNVKNKKATSLQAIGYKEVIWYIKGFISYQEMVRLLKRNTRRYAKRQFTWFRKYKQAHFINFDKKYNKELIYQIITEILDNSMII